MVSEVEKNAIEAKIMLLKLIKQDLAGIQYVRSSKNNIDNGLVGVVALSTAVTTGTLSTYFALSAYTAAYPVTYSPNSSYMHIPLEKTLIDISDYFAKSKGVFSLTLRGIGSAAYVPLVLTKNALIGLVRASPSLLGLGVMGSLASASAGNLYLLFTSEESFESFDKSIDQTIVELEALL